MSTIKNDPVELSLLTLVLRCLHNDVGFSLEKGTFIHSGKKFFEVPFEGWRLSIKTYKPAQYHHVFAETLEKATVRMTKLMEELGLDAKL